jgi:hypothetical protein
VARHSEEEIGLAGLEEALLRERSGRHETDHVPAQDGFRSALLRFRGILGLFADRNPVALRDQPLEIVVGALDRHAAHRNFLPKVPTALRQHDPERPAGDFRVFEEELVEISHAVEQEAAGMRLLDGEELRHHGRDPAGLRGGAAGGFGGASGLVRLWRRSDAGLRLRAGLGHARP